MIRSKNLTRRARFGTFALAASAAVLLAACGQKKDVGAADSANSEVAAKVNGDDISVGQVNLVLQHQRGMPPEASEAASHQALERLIDEQIVVQKAIAAKLDKDPQVVEQIEAARREILVHRFIETAADTASKPTDDQVQKFYDGRPAMFAQRKVFTLQRMDIQVPDERRAEVDAHVQSLKSLGELTDWLKAQNLKFNVKQEQDASEQLSPVILEKIAALKDGESTVIPSQAGVSAVTLLSSVTAPKTLADARPAIEQYLSQQGKREVVMNLQKTLRDGAKIDYQGRFAASAPAAATGASAVSTTPAAPAASSAEASASQNTPAQK